MMLGEKTTGQMKILEFIDCTFKKDAFDEIYWQGDNSCRVYTKTHCMDISYRNGNVICSELVLKENEMPFL